AITAAPCTRMRDPTGSTARSAATIPRVCARLLRPRLLVGGGHHAVQRDHAVDRVDADGIAADVLRAAQYAITPRATSPLSIASMAALMSASLNFRVTSWSSFKRPAM